MTEFLEALETGWGLEVVLWFQSWRTPLLFDAAFALSLTGEVLGFVLIWALLYWCIDARLGRRVGVTYFLAAWLNQWLKEWWQRPRPFQVSPQVDWPYASDSFGLPSGHATLTVTGWGVIAMWVRRRWATVAIATYVVLTVLTRLVLGVHYPHDLIVGSLIGLAALALYSRLEPRITAWLPSQSTASLIGMVIGLGAAMALVHPVLFPGKPEHRAEGAGIIGIFLGMAIGFVLEVRTVGFRPDGAWWRRIARYILGLVGLAVLMVGSARVFGDLTSSPIITLGSSAVAALWASFGAPWLFVRIRLADTEGAHLDPGRRNHEEA